MRRRKADEENFAPAITKEIKEDATMCKENERLGVFDEGEIVPVSDCEIPEEEVITNES